MRSPFASRIFVALTTLVALIGLAGTASAQDKLDRALREGRQSGKTQRVILKSKPGYQAWARKLLSDRNKAVDAELPSIGGFAVELTAAELDAFCGSSVASGCSEDTIVRPSGAAKKAKSTPPRGAKKAKKPGNRHNGNRNDRGTDERNNRDKKDRDDDDDDDADDDDADDDDADDDDNDDDDNDGGNSGS